MSDNTIIQQGRFTGTGDYVFLNLRSDVDWVRTYNMTTTAAGGAGTGVEFLWMRGMANDSAVEYQKLAADESMSPIVITTGGFTLIDESTMIIGAPNTTTTNIDTGAPITLQLGSTAGIAAGDIIRVSSPVGAAQIGGMDFEVITVVANTTLDLRWTPSIVAGTTATIRKIENWNPIFYPRARAIMAVTQAASAVVTLNVPHGLLYGSKVRFIIPDIHGMTELNGQLGTVTATSTANNTITVDIDTTGYTAFAWPLTAVAALGFTQAQVVPVGQDTTLLSGSIADTENEARLGMKLAGGTDSPGGAANDVIYFQAGKSFSVNQIS